MIAELAAWEFAWIWVLWALPLPLLAARLLSPAPAGHDAALRIPFVAELRALQTGKHGARSAGIALPLLAWSLLCVAAARPQILGEAEQPPQSGRDLLLAVDLSGSMAEEDMQLGAFTVDRLTAVKAVLGDFLDRRVGDRVGLLLFGDRAYAVTPLTPDRDSVRQQLVDSAIGIAGRETAIGDAIALSVKRLRDVPVAKSAGEQPLSDMERQPVVILLTDGVNTAGAIDPRQAAKLAAGSGVRVHTIGFGGEGDNSQFFGMRMRGPQIDEETLRAVAQATGGRYFRARATDELAQIYAELDRIEPVTEPGEVQRPRIERYPLPLGAALLVAALAFVLRLRPVRMELAR